MRNLFLVLLLARPFPVLASPEATGVERTAPGSSEDAAEGTDERPAPAPVGLGDLRAEPSRWLGHRVRFVLQFQGLPERWNPLLTRFGPAQWVALSGWADERFTWDERVFADPMRRLFVRRGTAQAAFVRELRPYERFEVVARVREVFAGEPWLEVESLRPRAGLVGEGVILHVVKAREAASGQRWRLAVDQVERAMDAPLPSHARAELETLRAFWSAQLAAQGERSDPAR